MLRKIYKNYRSPSIASKHHHKKFRAICEVLAGMAWHGPTPRPKQILTLPKDKKGSKGGAAARFAGIRVATAANPTTKNLRNAAHLGEISSNRWVEKMEELKVNLEALGGEARRRDEGERSWRSSRRQWRRRFRQSERERERKEENGRALSECGVPWRPCQHQRPNERGHRWRTGAIWRDRCRSGHPRRRARL